MSRQINVSTLHRDPTIKHVMKGTSMETMLAPVAVSNVVIDPSLEGLQQQLTGELITALHPEYDRARAAVYADIDRRPFAIVRAANALDVAATINTARELGRPLTVRGGGHSMSGFSVQDDAIMIDLSAMKRVTVDPVSQTARVQGGATSNELAMAAHEHDLALSTGDTRTVGIGGLATGGGIGFMARKYGLAIDNLVAAQVVTASGDILRVCESSHADLFWAIRGGGGNFGVVTEFTFRLAPVGRILGGMLVLPANAETLRAYLDYAVEAPEDLTTITNLLLAPPMPMVPNEFVGQPILMIMACWTGDATEGAQVMAKLRALGTPVVDTLGEMAYPDLYRFTDLELPPHAGSIRSMFAHQVSNQSVTALLDAMKQPSSPFSLIQFRAMGGAISRVPVAATAFAHRSQNYFVSIINLWLDVNNAAPHEAWLNATWNAIRLDASGVYVNFLEDEGPERLHEAYPAATYERLAQVKRDYDPTNLFRFNQNIAPTSA